ncbi:uncharacterized protein LOC128990026 [Macrosteles quadrilineatus]|uniref:uncharacterized protein LOC128990026 n=1 Tax=Macrosteles quadrilineatus TaxID=74068 RepID=UPI0023E2CAA9|nr:uncharacterized protein LOC128990026 [Macrosteles quadrilineatus]XP_054268213.1 uncharacterized protein LOC128990026 [Macrosteles quadrilineatus]
MYLQCAICREAYFLSASARSRHQQMCLALNDYFTSAVASNNDNRRETHEAAIQTPPQQIKAVPSGSGLKRKLPPPKVTKRPVTSVLSSPSSHTSSTTRLTWYLKKGLQSAKDYVIENNENLYKDLPPFIEAANEVVLDILQDELRVTKSLKYNVVLEAVYCHPEGHCELMNFKTTSRLIHSACDELQELLKKDASKLLREESEAQAKGSGWTLHEVKSLTLRLSKFSYALPAGSGYLPLPPKIAKRKCILNVKNSNDCCFMYCILAKSLPNIRYDSVLTEHSFRECETHYNFDGISFPTPISQMKKFEKQNINTSVNIFELDENAHITPLRIVDEQQDHFDLLLVRNDEGEAHFTLILNFTKLMQPQITKGSNKITICKRCSTFKENRRCVPTPQHWLSEHLMLCGKSKPSEVILPEQHKSKLRFVSYEMQIEVPIVVTADFESTLYPVPSTDNAYQRHEANSFAYIVASNLPKELLEEAEINTSPYIHRSESAAKEFLLQMQELAVKVEKLYTKNVSMIALNDEQQKQHDEATNCELCEIAFDETLVQSRKCRDHDHITGQFRYTLCSLCNTRCQLPNFIPIYFHNLSSYDEAFIIKNLAVLPNSEIKVIPSNSERFISISIKIGRMWLRFLDSFRLMADSLANLASYLTPTELVESSKLVPEQHVELIQRKGIYPYDYVKDFAVFSEEALPPRESFYNALNDSEVTDAEYQHAQHTWNTMKMKNFGQYHDFYLLLDVCLLMDIIQCFRKNCVATYNIDCCHSFTAPGLAWQSMLRMTGVTLELLTNYDHFLMFESAIRGGLVQCCHRYEKANNPLLENSEDYDPNKETKYMLYLDCINLYGSQMKKHLPTGNFEFVNDVDDLNWSNLPEDSPYGLLLECDVTVPEHLHDLMNDFPILPEQKDVDNQGKLLATLEDKKHYIAHYTVFQQAVKLGLKITKVHRALRFSQSPWMEKFIDKNTTLRAESTNEFSKNFYKFMNNSVFGKTLENVRNRVDIRIVTSDEAFQKLSRQARFVDRSIIADGVIAVHLRRQKVVLNKPVYVGSVVLDKAKVHMNWFHYMVMKKKLAPPDFEVYVNYSDTDSLLYTIITKLNLNNELKERLGDVLDRSCYPKEHELWLEGAIPQIGTFKDECKGRQLFEYVGLRCKMYCYRFNSSQQTTAKKKCKGISKRYVENKISFDHYKKALFEDKQYRATFNQIRSKTFQLTSRTVDKLSLSANDNKRIVLQDKIRTLAYGHYRARQNDDGGSSEYDSSQS